MRLLPSLGGSRQPIYIDFSKPLCYPRIIIHFYSFLVLSLLVSFQVQGCPDFGWLCEADGGVRSERLTMAIDGFLRRRSCRAALVALHVVARDQRLRWCGPTI